MRDERAQWHVQQAGGLPAQMALSRSMSGYPAIFRWLLVGRPSPRPSWRGTATTANRFWRRWLKFGNAYTWRSRQANLRYVVASGRVPHVGAVGDFLNIQPILTAIDGRLEFVAQVRSQRRAVERMLDQLATVLGDRPGRASPSRLPTCRIGGRLWETIRSRLNVVEVVIFDLGVVLASLGGPGLIGLGGYALEG